jgi:hypothetical protein
MSKNDWLLRNESTKAYIIVFFVYTPLMALGLLIIGALL